MQHRQPSPPHQRKPFSSAALFSILARLTDYPHLLERPLTPSHPPGLLPPKALAAYEDRWTDRQTHSAVVDVLRIRRAYLKLLQGSKDLQGNLLHFCKPSCKQYLIVLLSPMPRHLQPFLFLPPTDLFSYKKKNVFSQGGEITQCLAL